jgi:PKD repeat protein
MKEWINKWQVLALFIVLFANEIAAQKWDWAKKENVDGFAADANAYLFTRSGNTIKKFSPSGNFLWEKEFSGDLVIKEMATDLTGSLVLCGVFSSFSYGPQNYFSNGANDVFVGRFDENGNLLWGKVYGGPGMDIVSDLYIGNDQMIYIAGTFAAGSTVEGIYFSKAEFYCARLDLSGSIDHLIHHKGGTGWEIATDHDGNIFLLGGITENDTIDFGNGTSLTGCEPGCMGTHFMAKFYSNGSLQWAKNMGSNYYEPFKNLGVASNGEFYLTLWGRYSGFGLYKYDELGTFMWSRWQAGTYGGCSSLALDSDDAIWMTGSLWNGGGKNHQPFVWKFNDEGVLLDQILETASANGNFIKCDGQNNVFVSGNFTDSIAFGNVIFHEKEGNYFLAKLNGLLPEAGFSMKSPSCENQQMVFRSTSFNATSFLWEFPGGNPPSSSDSIVTVTFGTPGKYTVKLIAANDVSADTITRAISVLPQPAPPLITQSSNTLYSNYSQGNQWIFNSDSIRLATGSSYDITVEGNYQVLFTDAEGCYSMSVPFTAYFDNISEIIEPGTSAWIKIIKGPDEDAGTTLAQTNDGGFLIAARTSSFPVNQYDFNTLLVRYDSLGNKTWSKIIRPDRSAPYELKPTADGGYALLFALQGSIGLSKLNSDGEVQFSKSFKSEDWQTWPGSLALTVDGGFIINGQYSTGSAELDFHNSYMLKVDANGTAQWGEVYAPGYSRGYSVLQEADGSYMLNGYGSFPAPYASHNFLSKADSGGGIQWMKLYKNLGSISESARMIRANDGGYIMAGATEFNSEGGYDAYVMKTDGQGNVIWCKIYGTVYQDKALSVISTGDGYAVLGNTEGFRTAQDLYLFKIDNNGNHLWSRSYGTAEIESGISLLKAADGGFVITGCSGKDIYFLKTDAGGNTGCRSLIVHTKSKDIAPLVENYSPHLFSRVHPETRNNFSEVVSVPDSVICSFDVLTSDHLPAIAADLVSIYPNPTSGIIKIEYNSAKSRESKNVSVYDVAGKCVYLESFNPALNSFAVDLGRQPKGVYFIKLCIGDKRINRKVVLH